MYRPRTRDAGDRHGRRSAATCAPRERSLPPVRRTAFRRGHRGSGSPSLGYRKSLSGARIARIDAGVRPHQAGPTRQARTQRRPRLTDGPNARRRRHSELARPIRRDAVTWAGPVVVDDFPQEIPITQRELDVIETYLGALLDEALGVPG